MLILEDGVDYLRGRLGSFDPAGIIGLVGVVIFFISPILQSHWDYWPFLPDLSNETGWMALWALLNLLGILLYKAILSKSVSQRPSAYGYSFNKSRLKLLMPLVLAFSFAMQVYVYQRFGGLSGFISTFTQRQSEGLVSASEDPFEGMGLPMLFAESFKLLIAIYAIYWLKRKEWAAKPAVLLLIMALFGAVFLAFGGLRGSRSSTLFSLFIAAGMYSYWIKPISIKFILVGLLSASAFMTTYYWYKIAGTEGIAAIFDSSYRQSFSGARQDATKYVVSRDMGRMDVQVLALKRHLEDGYPYSFGRTFVTAPFSVIPKSILPLKPDQITKEKTELLYGPGTYDPNAPRQTTLVLGQFGEFFINFGVVGVLVFFAILGLITRKLRAWSRCWPEWDVRRFLLPAFSLVPILMIITDMNVIILNMTRYLLLPVIVILICAKRIRVTKPS
ncbi:MAG: O-antigen polymerase [Luteimonas sp.]